MSDRPTEEREHRDDCPAHPRYATNTPYRCRCAILDQLFPAEVES